VKYLIVFILFSYILNSQDILNPEPLLFDIRNPQTGTIVNDSLTSDYFEEEFILGWQWGGDPRFNEATYCNMTQTATGVNILSYYKK